jgi:vacuolar-type H+-ATPase subunit I/STV1
MLAKLLQDQLGVNFNEIKETGQKLAEQAEQAAADIEEIKQKQNDIISKLNYIIDRNYPQ